MAEPLISIEVVHAAVDRQLLIRLSVPQGTTMAAVLCLPEVAQAFASVDWGQAAVGIFGRVIVDPQAQVLAPEDRIEIYRPLLADPKEIRRLRAAKAARDRARS